MDSLWHDVRHAARSLARQRTVTVAALLTLALGIGANTAVFSVLYGVLLRPLPYPEPDNLVQVWEEHPGANAPVSGMLSDLTLRAWSPNMKTLADLAEWSETTYTVGRENPERLRGASVSPELFPLLRATPAAGRFFGPDEAVEGASDVAVLSYGYWQDRFGGDAEALGQTLVLDGEPHTIVGVASPGLAFPAPETLFWTPFVVAPPPADENTVGIQVFNALGRLAPGVSPEQVATEGTAAARSVTRPFIANMLFGEGGEVQVRVERLVDEMTADVRPALRVLAAGVGLVLLIACANVANLLLTRGMTRRRELAVRSALGASRTRIARHLLTESLLVAGAGGVAGWLVADGLTRLLPILAPADFPRLDSIRLDARALAFAIGASLLSGLGSGLIPALRGARVDRTPSLHDGDARSTGAGGKRLRAGLLAAEAALAVVLVVGATLLVRSFVSMTHVDSGYDPTNVLMGRLHFPDAEQNQERIAETLDQLQRRLEARPDVVAVGASNMAPLGGSTSISGFALPATGTDAEPARVRANTWVVTPGFSDALGLRVTAGRFLRPEDIGSGTQALVVNEEFVRLFLADGQPVVGRRYESLLTEDDVSTEIVGVVANVLKDGPTRAPQPEIYLLSGGQGRALANQLFLLVRTTGNPLRLVPELRELVGQVAPLAALDGVGTVAGRLSSALAQPRFATAVLGSFALLALLLAATGLYGVMSYNVSQRRREMGVRAALGASRAALVRLVMSQGLSVVVVGLVIGLGTAAAVTRLMQGLLFGVDALDPVAFAVAPLILLVVAVLACLSPARRATAVGPAIALRSE